MPARGRRARACRLLLAIVGALAAGACEPRPPAASPPLDRAALRRTVIEQHLAPLLAGDGAGRRTDALRPTGTGRLLFLLAAGDTLTGDPRYRAALRRQADRLVAHGIAADGAVFEHVAADGTVRDARNRLYGQAFALFGLAHAFRITGEARYRDAATKLWGHAEARLHDASGAMHLPTDARDAAPDTPRSQNPLMHLFEALLAWFVATGDRAWRVEAEAIAAFVHARLLVEAPSGRCIPELYDATGAPLSAAHGGYVDLGHQVEWASLLSEGAEHGVRTASVATGAALLDYALAAGYDGARGGLIWRADAGDARAGEKIDWVQSELLRALLRYRVRHGRQDLRPPYEQTLAFVQAEFVDPVHGGWHARPRAICRQRGCPAQHGEAEYHVVTMYLDALQLTR